MHTLTQDSAHFPPSLKEARPIPESLYYNGSLDALSRPLISIVGSRKMSTYGSAVLQALVPPLVQAGLVVVSGLAYGVDAAAHRCALDHGGTGIAVIGSSLDQLYPASHTSLADKLVRSGGIVLSEYPPGTPGFKFHFPRRNRIIAALSPVLLIIEAADPSGTFSTARAALEMGKEVCVVPADITRGQSNGTLRLLKDGARPVSCPEDILSLYQMQLPLLAKEPLQPALTGSPATLYASISHGLTSVDALAQDTGFNIATVQALLSVLELDGYITYRQSQWQTTL
ncbi:MAG TPA: DNA-processing protein DprA [Verrucomicrobiae bacterium]|nr:DNA-processing protein DprA [Verrucomicrobiae bacterium]